MLAIKQASEPTAPVPPGIRIRSLHREEVLAFVPIGVKRLSPILSAQVHIGFARFIGRVPELPEGVAVVGVEVKLFGVQSPGEGGGGTTRRVVSTGGGGGTVLVVRVVVEVRVLEVLVVRVKVANGISQPDPVGSKR